MYHGEPRRCFQVNRERLYRERTLNLIQDHRRVFADNRFVYAVVARRSKGVSIGINLNPDKICNFDCIYCQVDRQTPATVRTVEVPRLLDELEHMLDLVQTGRLFQLERFHPTPPELRRLNDIAFSGDGEPASSPVFAEVVAEVARVRHRRGLSQVKLVLITNASRFHQPAVQEALAVLDANNGEIWAKLDGGTAEHYQAINRTTIPFAQVLANITAAAQVRPLVIQSLFCRQHGLGPSAAEIAAFGSRLNEILAAGGQLKLVQVSTVVRPPAESWASSLPNQELDAIAANVQSQTGLPAEAFYGTEDRG